MTVWQVTSRTPAGVTWLGTAAKPELIAIHILPAPETAGLDVTVIVDTLNAWAEERTS